MGGLSGSKITFVLIFVDLCGNHPRLWLFDLQSLYSIDDPLLQFPKTKTDNNSRLIEVDDFIAKLWEVHLAVKKEGYVQVSLRPASAH